METTITVGSAVDLIDYAVDNFTDGLKPDYVEIIIKAVNNHLQIRDYLIGLPASHEISKCVDFLSYLSKSVDEQDRFAVDTVNAMYQFELENFENSLELLANAHETNPNYNLTNLVTRAIEAGWPSNSFSTMRNELFAKVNEHLVEISDEVIA